MSERERIEVVALGAAIPPNVNRERLEAELAATVGEVLREDHTITTTHVEASATGDGVGSE